jgi:hypothetical protein
MPRRRLRHLKCERQELNLHTMLSDGVATVRQSFGRGFERYRLVATVTRAPLPRDAKEKPPRHHRAALWSFSDLLAG